MANQTWKSLERRLASMLGPDCERVPVTGRGMGSAPDIESPKWSIEVKHRKVGLPQWQVHAHAQAQASRKPQHLAAISIIHTKNQRLENAIVQMTLKDFLALDGMVRTDRQTEAADSV